MQKLIPMPKTIQMSSGKFSISLFTILNNVPDVLHKAISRRYNYLKAKRIKNAITFVISSDISHPQGYCIQIFYPMI